MGDLVTWLHAADHQDRGGGRAGAAGRAWRCELRAQFDDRLFIAKSLPFFLEVAQPGRLQGRGARWCADRLDIDPANVVAFGDGANDIELLEEAGFGVAIDTADAALLAHAGATVPPPEQDGVAGFWRR